MSRDYVKRKKQTKRNRVIPNLMIMLAIILIVLFATLLYLLAKREPNQVSKVPVKTAPPAMTLPEQPQERWTYLKELEKPNSDTSIRNSTSERQQILNSFSGNFSSNSTVKTVTTEQQTKTPEPLSSKWQLQCGAFKERTNADGLRAKLAMSGITGKVINGSLFRVIAGPYNSKIDADKAVSALKSNGIKDCIVTDR
ncbi:SPOR domain-containing protein [Orbaceae bacterium ESL0721]|nr:SPOR domain-containing protein [Orbaceae bacterium ESL0721]